MTTSSVSPVAQTLRSFLPSLRRLGLGGDRSGHLGSDGQP